MDHIDQLLESAGLTSEQLSCMHAAALTRYQKVRDLLVAEVPRTHSEDWNDAVDVPMTVFSDGRDALYYVRWSKKKRVFVNMHWPSPKDPSCKFFKVIPEEMQ